MVGWTHVSSVITICLLCRRGTSQELKRKVFNRHFTYLLIYDFYFIQGVFFEFQPTSAYDIEYLFNTVGVLIALVRLLEPFVFSTLVEAVRKLCPVGKYHSKTLYSKQALCSFVNSAMNIEYVYLILVGVNQFMDLSASDAVQENKITIKKEKNKTNIRFRHM